MTDPKTGGALFKGTLFGSNGAQAENSATANLGDSETASATIQQANADTDRANGQYGDVTAKDGADLEATDNDDLDDDLNVTGAILNGTEANTETPATDSFNNQGAISSDSENL